MCYLCTSCIKWNQVLLGMLETLNAESFWMFLVCPTIVHGLGAPDMDDEGNGFASTSFDVCKRLGSWTFQDANSACHGRAQYFQSVWTKSGTIVWQILISKLKLGEFMPSTAIFVRFYGLDFPGLWAVRAGLAGHPWHSHHGACAVQRHPCAEAHPHTDGPPQPCGVPATRGSVTQQNRCHCVMAWVLEQGVHRRCCIDSSNTAGITTRVISNGYHPQALIQCTVIDAMHTWYLNISLLKLSVRRMFFWCREHAFYFDQVYVIHIATEHIDSFCSKWVRWPFDRGMFAGRPGKPPTG